jgi:hypothetical protein
MIEHQRAVTLEPHPEEAFDVFVDFDNEPAWNPDCLTVEKTSKGPIGPGAHTGEMKDVGPGKSAIAALGCPSHCSIVDRSRGAEGIFDLRLTPHDGGTRVEVTLRIQPRGPTRLLEPLMDRMVKETLADMPEKMRRGIDAAEPAR